jgi:hypothetical protein
MRSKMSKRYVESWGVKLFKEIKSEETDILHLREKSLVWASAEDQNSQRFLVPEEEGDIIYIYYILQDIPVRDL